MAKYRFVGWETTEFPSLVLGGPVEPGDEFEIDDDIVVSHALVERDVGGDWQPTADPETSPLAPDNEEAVRAQRDAERLAQAAGTPPPPESGRRRTSPARSRPRKTTNVGGEG